jgi:3-oxoacyl-[acyl-carrier protein] reductase
MSDRGAIVITGARKGIGRFLAEYYLGQGCRVAGCSRQPSDLRADNYLHGCVDVRDEPAVCAFMADVRSRWGGVGALINNAGVAAMNHTLLMPLKTAKQVLEINVLGTFLLCREAAKLLRSTPHARIVNFSTVAVPLNVAGEAVYAASKAAVETLTRVLARELAPLEITCNAVGPTPIQTDLLRGVSRQKIDRLIAAQAIPRMGQPQDVANVVDFFLRPESDFVTGQVIYLGGVS